MRYWSHALKIAVFLLAFLILGAGKHSSADGILPSGKPAACDRVINMDCQPGMWTSTDREWCGFSWACAFNLPPFSAHFVEQEKTTVCHFRCENGYTYTRSYYERRALRVGCCGGGLAPSSGGRGVPCSKPDASP